MIEVENRTILITESDKTRLEGLVDYAKNALHRDQRYIEMLEQELEHAEVVPGEEIPPDVVTMNSQVRVKDLDTGKVAVYALVFPRDADYSKSRISVLAPIGTALLGYREGDVIEWRFPAGMRRLRIEAILYQPEAAGEKPDPARVRDLFVLYQART